MQDVKFAVLIVLIHLSSFSVMHIEFCFHLISLLIRLCDFVKVVNAIQCMSRNNLDWKI